jgi:thiamine-phosphate pyrophosphorylase
MLRYSITSRALFAGDDAHRQTALLDQCARWACVEGIDFIQLREKDLPAADLASLARRILTLLANARSTTKLLINARPDVALATAAHGVHLTAAPGELTPSQVRELYVEAGCTAPVLSVSTHTVAEVIQASNDRVDAILFAPVFEKSIAGRIVTPGQGLEQLHRASIAAAPVPVYALGGVTLENAASCIAAGAAGIAGIRLFHDPAFGEKMSGVHTKQS